MQIAQLDFGRLYQEMNQSGGRFTFSEGLELGTIVSALVPFIFVAAGLVLFLLLAIGGFGLLTSRGDPKAVQQAKDRITFALVGFIIIFVSYWIMQIVGQVLGIDVIINTFR
jgi:lipopolysaccharide export LptBFGC system permease protein LptF